jgi:hypothetical protein
MNLVDTEKTPLYRAFDMVKMEAEAQGVSPTWSEIVGLVPERALFDTAARHIALRDFKPEMVLEHKVRAAIQGGESLSGFVAAVASPVPAPGGGSVAALAGALGAALAQMVAGLTFGRKKYAGVDAEMRELGLKAAGLVNKLSALVAKDAEAYGAVTAAYKLPSNPRTRPMRDRQRSPTPCSAPPRFRSRPRAPALRWPTSRRYALRRETRMPFPTPASPRCSPKLRAVERFIMFESTFPRSRIDLAARASSPRQTSSSHKRGEPSNWRRPPWTRRSVSTTRQNG